MRWRYISLNFFAIQTILPIATILAEDLRIAFSKYLSRIPARFESMCPISVRISSVLPLSQIELIKTIVSAIFRM